MGSVKAGETRESALNSTTRQPRSTLASNLESQRGHSQSEEYILRLETVEARNRRRGKRRESERIRFGMTPIGQGGNEVLAFTPT
jgi:hypothetical protein